MLAIRNVIIGIIIVIVGLFVYKFRVELRPLVTSVFNNLYISHLDTADCQAVFKFMNKYKASIKLRGIEVDQTVNHTQKLLQQNNLAVFVAYNLLGNFIGYMAVDLKTGFVVFYYILHKGSDFFKIYKNLLQNLESFCKKKGLKNLIVPIIPAKHYQENSFLIGVDLNKNNYLGLNQSIDTITIKILQDLGYEPLEGWSKFKQGFKGLFLGSYQYDSAWIKNL